LIRWVCTSNPFYVLSAGLFLAGLWISFGDPAQAEDTWAMMSGLTGYTLLLAVAAFLLVRFCKVWDDVRTVLLLVVLMFLATSVTFDQVLVLSPRRGFACYLGGLLFAVAVSEGLLRGIRLRLPAWYRLPYYLILALFFLYPLALSPLLARPRGETLMWGLFGFSGVAGLVFLTLLPAIRRGPHYVRGNGSPWPWPLYPWSLFGMLGLAVLGRAFLLCWSMQLLDGPERFQSMFGPYFLVLFGLAVAVLILEGGLVSGRRTVLAAALLVPVGLIGLALVGHRPDPVYQEFLEVFATRLGGDPLYLTLLVSMAFYGYATLRRVPLAVEGLTVALLALAVIGSDTLTRGELVAIRWAPILLAAVLQLGLGLWRRESWRCVVGSGGLVVVAVLTTGSSNLRTPIGFHLALLAVLVLGAVFNDVLGRLLRIVGAGMVMVACLAVLFVWFDYPSTLPPWRLVAYPLAMTALLAAYGLWLGHRPSLAIAALLLTCWLGGVGWRGYRALRLVVVGLDYIALSLTLFLLAFLISVGKSGVVSRWLTARRRA
jgi:hypothetical protein